MKNYKIFKFNKNKRAKNYKFFMEENDGSMINREYIDNMNVAEIIDNNSDYSDKDNKEESQEINYKDKASSTISKLLKNSKKDNSLNISSSQYKDEQENNINNSSNFNNIVNKNENNSIKIIKINLVIGNSVKSIALVMSNMTELEIVIQKAIIQFNIDFIKKKAKYRLKTRDFENYDLKSSNKDGFPENESPSYNHKLKIKDLDKSNFTLVWKNEPNNFKIYFKKIKREKNPIFGSCYNCLLF